MHGNKDFAIKYVFVIHSQTGCLFLMYCILDFTSPLKHSTSSLSSTQFVNAHVVCRLFHGLFFENWGGGNFCISHVNHITTTLFSPFLYADLY